MTRSKEERAATIHAAGQVYAALIQQGKTPSPALATECVGLIKELIDLLKEDKML